MMVVHYIPVVCPDCERYDGLAVHKGFNMYYCFHCNDGGPLSHCPKRDDIIAKVFEWIRTA